jgi:hypothetical protein
MPLVGGHCSYLHTYPTPLWPAQFLVELPPRGLSFPSSASQAVPGCRADSEANGLSLSNYPVRVERELNRCGHVGLMCQ